MELVIDGLIFEIQTHGGASRIYQETLPRICSMDPSITATILTSGKLKQALPAHYCINHISLPPFQSFIRPRRFFGWSLIHPLRTTIQKIWLGNSRGRIWHSTHYTKPKNWEGPIVVTVLDLIPEKFSHLYHGGNYNQFRKQKKDCIETADALICISESTRNDLISYYRVNPQNIFVTHLASTEKFRKIETLKVARFRFTQKPYFLYVGARNHYKNFDFLLRAYAIWPGNDEIDLVVVGQGWSRREKTRLQELNIADQVHLVRNCSDEYLSQLYNAAEAFVYPSLYEGFGIPLLEAMACGCPIIASHIPSSVEIADTCAIYFNPYEIDDLISAFEKSLSDGRSSTHVLTGLERAKQFSWDKTAGKTLEIYRSLQ